MSNTQYRTSKTPLALCLSLALLTVGCTTDEAVDKPENKEQVTASNRVPQYQKMSREEQDAFTRQDLATRLGVELDAVSVSGSTAVKWRTSALGCPQPGMTYTQMLVPGQLTMLRVGNTAYRYHSLPAGEPFFCPEDRAEFPYVGSGDT